MQQTRVRARPGCWQILPGDGGVQLVPRAAALSYLVAVLQSIPLSHTLCPIFIQTDKLSNFLKMHVP